MAPPDLGAIVARVGAVPIFGSQVLAESKRTGKSHADALQDLIDMNAMAEAFHHAGHQPPDASDWAVSDALVQRLLERALEPKLRPDAIPDSTLRSFYDRARNLFVHPRLVEVGVLEVHLDPSMKPDQRAARAQTARDLAQFVKEHPPKTLQEFAAIAHQPAWSKRHISALRFTQSLDHPLSKSVGAEILKLHAPGDTTPLLSDDAGFYLARFIREQPAKNLSYEQVRAQLASRYFDRWQRGQFLDFTNKLMRRHKVQEHFDRLQLDEKRL